MAKAMTSRLEQGCSDTRDRFSDYLKKEQSSRDAARIALASCYAYAQECFRDAEAFGKLCESSGVKESRSDASPYLRVVRLVFGRITGGTWEPINPQQASKYANLLDYAKFKKISVKGFDEWLRQRSHEGYLADSRIDDAYQKGRSGNGANGSAPDRFSIALEQASQKAEALFGGNAALKIDLSADGAPLVGFHNMAVEVSDDGDVKIIGFTNDKPEAVEKSICRTFRRPPTVKGEHPQKELLSVIQFSNAIKGTRTNPAYITFTNRDDRCDFLISHVGREGAPIGKVATSTLPDFPMGETLVLTPENADSIWRFRKKTKSFTVSKGSGEDVEDVFVTGTSQATFRKKHRSVWKASYSLIFAVDGTKIATSLFTAAPTTKERLDTRRKRINWDVEIQLTDVLMDQWVTQEKLAPKGKPRYSVGFDETKINFFGWNGTHYGEMIPGGEVATNAIRLNLVKRDVSRVLKIAKKMKVNDLSMMANADMIAFAFDDHYLAFVPVLCGDGKYSKEGFKKIAW